MKRFENFPIRIKLILLFLLISFSTLAISATFFVYNDLKLFKQNLLNNLAILAGTVGANSRSAIYFEDKDAASKILSSLSENPQIKNGVLYDSQGNEFVAYDSEVSEKKSFQITEESFRRIDKETVELKKSIFLKDKKIGEIYLTADLKEYNAVLIKYVGIVGLILFFTFVVALLIAFKLQRIISQPISHLSKTTKDISKNNDYSVKVTHPYQDEIGELFNSFNEMISKIGEREKELDATNKSLLKEVEQRRTAEKILKVYSKELENSNQELQDFTSVASHDLQEPLRKIISFGDRLASQLPDSNDKAKQYVEPMQRSAQRMKQFIDDLLDYSRVGAKAKPFGKVDLNKVIYEVLENLEIQISESNAQIDFENLPSIEVDETQIYQLFQNLIGNAIKFKKKDSPSIIKIEAQSNVKGFWEITVQDNGIGFNEKYLDRIFKPFERLHGKNEYPGSGMGLTICNKIVNRHGGTLKASSSPENGTTFKIVLPEVQKVRKNIFASPLVASPRIKSEA